MCYIRIIIYVYTIQRKIPFFIISDNFAINYNKR